MSNTRTIHFKPIATPRNKKVQSGDYRSAFSVKKLQTYCWFENHPVNYDPNDMAQTQDLEPVFAETSGFYIFRKEDYLQSNTRINKPEYPVEISELEGIDIDTEEDYNSALRAAQQPNVIRHSRLIFCQLYPKDCA